ncbi:MAG: TRAP transporter small permease [Gammaproteobacteria bacterium]|nr:TRAP transporter small permease [Gammaproteobacteria bacterium]
MISKSWNRLEAWLTGLLALFALGTAIFEMFVRLAIPAWTSDGPEEIIVYTLVWALFVCASTLAAEQRHVRVDILLIHFPQQGKRFAESVSALAGLFFSVMLLYYGALAALEAWELDERSVSMLRLPLWIYYTCLPVGCLLLSLRYTIRLISLIFFFKPALIVTHETLPLPKADNPERESQP